MALTLLAKLMKAPIFFSCNDIEYQIQDPCYISSWPKGFSCWPKLFMQRLFRLIPILLLSWVQCSFWNDDLSCHNSSKRSGFYHFFWVVISRAWTSACRIGSNKGVILTILLLLSIPMYFPLLVFLCLFQKLYISNKIIAALWLLSLRVFLSKIFSGKVIRKILSEIELYPLWTTLIHVFDAKKWLKFCLFFNLNDVFNDFFPVVNFLPALF